MSQTDHPRRGSFVGPIILIFLGVLFLAWNFSPSFDPWPILARYWPLILIFIGLGKLGDSYLARKHPDRSTGGSLGTTIAWIALLMLFVLAVWHGGPGWYGGWDWHGRRDWHGRAWGAGMHEMHDTQAVELQGAKSVSANLHMPAGTLTLSGGSGRLLDADFSYGAREEKPRVDYAVSGGHGQLDVVQQHHGVQFGPRDDDWNLRFGGDALLDLDLEMGAGHGDVRLSGLNVSRLDVHMGAGELNLDLTGERNIDLRADIQGGAGSATIRLPKSGCARVHASGGIGSINTRGMRRDGDDYVNEACGKTTSAMDISVQGGVGEINLFEEP